MKTILLPNGYGSLEYIKTLDKELKSNDIDSQIVNYSGTGGNNALMLDVSSVKENIKNKVNDLTAGNTGVNIISHCSSIIPLTQIDRSDKFWNNVKNVIIYGYLANPLAHMDRFIEKSNKYGSNLNIDNIFSQIDNFSYKSLENIPKEIHIIHHNSKLNSIRANSKDLHNLLKVANISDVYKPKIGYEIKNRPQRDLVKYIVDNYYLKIA